MNQLKEAPFRKEVTKNLTKVLKKKDLVTKIENSILNYSLDFCKDNQIDDEMCEYIYNEKYEQILEIIKTDVKVFLKKITDKVLKPEQIAFLSPQELDPSKWEKLLKKKEEARKNLQEANITYEYTCSKCKNNKHTEIALQTRSADEPMTHFITCTNCGFTFKQ
jgi:DNA-directed RNA polymerase subunit M/transcription elongation factor TFIIS